MRQIARSKQSIPACAVSRKPCCSPNQVPALTNPPPLSTNSTYGISADSNSHPKTASISSVWLRAACDAAQFVPLQLATGVSSLSSEMILTLNHALEELAGFDELAARVIELRFFLGCTLEETAEVLDVSVRAKTFRSSWMECSQNCHQTGKSI